MFDLVIADIRAYCEGQVSMRKLLRLFIMAQILKQYATIELIDGFGNRD